jgi:Plasmid pRiA4b ORF-3-like protein
MARTWLSIRVDLVACSGERLWPRPGRLFAAARSHTFAQLAAAIDNAFARWDGSHLHEFKLADGNRLGMPSDDGPDPLLDYRQIRLSRLQPGDRFAYVFDFGDNWQHVCAIGPERIDPLQVAGRIPTQPLPYFGWGDIPDQYRRRWEGDDGESLPPPNPGLADLPPLLRGWGGTAWPAGY